MSDDECFGTEQLWRIVPIGDIRVACDVELHPDHILRLRESYERLGAQVLLQPIAVDHSLNLIDGAHRLEAAKQAGWSHIATLVFIGTTSTQQRLIEIEANRVRREFSPLELEQVWREHYEPALRAKGKSKRLRALNKTLATSVPVSSASAVEPAPLVASPTVSPVLGNSDNSADVRAAVSLARSAKQVTGLSIDTLRKITEVRTLSESTAIPPAVRAVVAQGMLRLQRPRASVDAVYRSVHAALQQHHSGETAHTAHLRASETALERTLQDCSVLAEQLSGTLAEMFESAARNNAGNRDQLRAVRMALARALATVVAVECRLEPEPIEALRHLGSDVSRLLSSTSIAQLKVG